MLAKIYSAAVYGVDAYEVEIEVNGAGGDPNIVIVGLPDAAVKESRDRVTTAIANSGYFWPRGRKYPLFAIAVVTRSRLSFTAASGKPTMTMTGSPPAPFTSISTSYASTP